MFLSTFLEGKVVAIVGSRDLEERYHPLVEDFVITECRLVKLLVSGGAKGVDSLAEAAAKYAGIPFQVIPPDWDKHGKRAGFVRNQDIVARSEVVVSFWNGVSRGSEHTQKLAQQEKKVVIAFTLRPRLRVVIDQDV